MKKTFLISVFLLIACLLTAQTGRDTLTNEKVIQLSKIGLDASVLISKIETSIPKFDVSTDGLIYLSSNGVSAEVINAMMKADAQAKAELANKKDMNDPKSMRPSGIYYYDPADSAKLFKRIDPAVISNTRSGGIAGGVVGGVVKNKLRASLAGSNSKMQLNESSPVFYFYFDRASNSNADNWFFASASSPNEFVLVKFDEKKNSREIVVGTENAYGSNLGIPNKDKIPFNSEEIADGVYKVSFNAPLKSSEYCFLYASSTPTNYANDKVFDFGIQVEK
ncbi:MAG: hypothetical protein IPM36_09805 [Lewinellaceae bacterium]|nr:hypothetical protein [Lewinellaceae bacterium]